MMYFEIEINNIEFDYNSMILFENKTSKPYLLIANKILMNQISFCVLLMLKKAQYFW